MVLSFSPLQDRLDSVLDKDSISSLILDGFNDVKSLHYDGKDHVLMLCSRRVGRVAVEGDANTSVYDELLDLLVLHIPSKNVINSCCLTKCNEIDECQKLSYDGTKSDIMAFYEKREGVMITSCHIRGLKDHATFNASSNTSTSTKSKKKKRLASKGGKKDGFARGMSLRG